MRFIRLYTPHPFRFGEQESAHSTTAFAIILLLLLHTSVVSSSDLVIICVRIDRKYGNRDLYKWSWNSPRDQNEIKKNCNAFHLKCVKLTWSDENDNWFFLSWEETVRVLAFYGVLIENCVVLNELWMDFVARFLKITFKVSKNLTAN